MQCNHMGQAVAFVGFVLVPGSKPNTIKAIIERPKFGLQVVDPVEVYLSCMPTRSLADPTGIISVKSLGKSIREMELPDHRGTATP